MTTTLPFSAETGFLIDDHSLTVMKRTDWLKYSTKAASPPRTDGKARKLQNHGALHTHSCTLHASEQRKAPVALSAAKGSGRTRV